MMIMMTSYFQTLVWARRVLGRYLFLALALAYKVRGGESQGSKPQLSDRTGYRIIICGKALWLLKPHKCCCTAA